MKKTDDLPPQSSITQKGQVTIPLEIRKAMGLKTGEKVEFVSDGLRVFLQPARKGSNPFSSYEGRLKGHSKTKKDINKWLAELRDDNHRD